MPETSLPTMPTCPIDHRQLSDLLIQVSLAEMQAIVFPIIAAKSAPSAQFIVRTVHSTKCHFLANPCQSVQWELRWSISYLTDAAGEKVVTHQLLASAILPDQV